LQRISMYASFLKIRAPCIWSFLLCRPPWRLYVVVNIVDRKEMFAARIQRLPIIKWLTTMLTAAENHRLEWDVVQAALDLEFPSEEARRQLDTAVRSGRYAEILVYEDNTEMIYLEPGGTLHQTENPFSDQSP
jgi:hypothetical protein